MSLDFSRTLPKTINDSFICIFFKWPTIPGNQEIGNFLNILLKRRNGKINFRGAKVYINRNIVTQHLFYELQHIILKKDT